METPEYMDYLCKQIQEVKSFAGEDEIQISYLPVTAVSSRLFHRKQERSLLFLQMILSAVSALLFPRKIS